MAEVDFFTPAQVGRASEDVALQIEAAIIEGKIAPGENLPSERELQGLFQTGRGVIREALRALKQKGLIEVRKGAKGGAFVKQMEVANASESLALFLKQNHIPPGQVIEFRESLDRTITTLAIARGTEAEKKSLLRKALKLEELLRQPTQDPARISELDRELNIDLAMMTRNPIFEWIMRAIQLGFSSYDYTLYDDPDYRTRTAANWTETAREILRGEPLRALGFSTQHYALLQKCIEEKNGDLLTGNALLETEEDREHQQAAR
jgi:DNA-binding FadR family transcriptional regulator